MAGQAATYPIAEGAYTVTDEYGVARSYGMHTGRDLAAKQGTKIGAPVSGKVVSVQQWKGTKQGADAYGNSLVILDPATGQKHRLSHASEVLVQPGQEVREGQPVALVGSTGNSTGPHLDWEVILPNGKTMDPRQWWAQQGEKNTMAANGAEPKPDPTAERLKALRERETALLQALDDKRKALSSRATDYNWYAAEIDKVGRYLETLVDPQTKQVRRGMEGEYQKFSAYVNDLLRDQTTLPDTKVIEGEIDDLRSELNNVRTRLGVEEGQARTAANQDKSGRVVKIGNDYVMYDPGNPAADANGFVVVKSVAEKPDTSLQVAGIGAQTAANQLAYQKARDEADRQWEREKEAILQKRADNQLSLQAAQAAMTEAYNRIESELAIRRQELDARGQDITLRGQDIQAGVQQRSDDMADQRARLSAGTNMLTQAMQSGSQAAGQRLNTYMGMLPSIVPKGTAEDITALANGAKSYTARSMPAPPVNPAQVQRETMYEALAQVSPWMRTLLEQGAAAAPAQYQVPAAPAAVSAPVPTMPTTTYIDPTRFQVPGAAPPGAPSGPVPPWVQVPRG